MYFTFKTILPALLALALFSCGDKKKATPYAPVIPYIKYNDFGLKKGNWWVYACTGNKYPAPYTRDSVVVSQDTAVGNITYYKFKSYPTPAGFSLFPLQNHWFTDSANYIVSLDHKKYYTTADFTGNLQVDSLVTDNGSGPEVLFYYRLFKLAGTKQITVNGSAQDVAANVYEVTPYKPNPPYNGVKKYYHYLNNTGFVKFEHGYGNDTSAIITNQLLRWHVDPR